MNSNSKTNTEIEEHPMKTIKIDESMHAPEKTLKITDLNDYCLEHIFDYLDFKIC